MSTPMAPTSRPFSAVPVDGHLARSRWNIRQRRRPSDLGPRPYSTTRRCSVPESLDQMLDWVPLGIEPDRAQILADYGLGAARYNPDLFDGTLVIGHSGGARFYSAAALYLPDYGVAIGAAQNFYNEETVGSTLSQVVDLITTHVEPAVEAPLAVQGSTTADGAWVELDLTFMSGGDELHGVLALPAPEGPHPAVVMPFDSVGTGGGLPPGVFSGYQTDLARRLAGAGYAAFRYDPPGVGKSEGDPGFLSMQARADETIAALHRVQEHPAVRADQVGLWGISQEAWVISIAAADHPDDVAFIIAVSGSGISVAEQQVWGIETQSEAAGLEPGDVELAHPVWPVARRLATHRPSLSRSEPADRRKSRRRPLARLPGARLRAQHSQPSRGSEPSHRDPQLGPGRTLGRSPLPRHRHHPRLAEYPSRSDRGGEGGWGAIAAV